MRTLWITFIVLLSTGSAIYGQDQHFQRLQYPVNMNGQSLPYPFAGGMNAPQFSPADLNNDGILDLVVFDRAGDLVMTFLNSGTANTIDYHYAPEYACWFPKLNDWALLRDFDKDGAADIFCAAHQPGSQEIQAYKGYYDDNVLKFTPFLFHYPNCSTCDPRYIWYPDELPGFYNNLPIARSDVPAFDDVDGDGDLDLLAFPSGATTHIWYFRNTSVEQGFGLDSLKFVADDRCWGGFFENGLEACRASLAAAPGECYTPLLDDPTLEGRGVRHPGATISSFDLEGDGDLEVLLGNISFACVSMLKNCGTPQQAWVCEQDTAFPSYNSSIDLTIFPATFVFDVNNDGKKDLVAAPNNKTIGEDQKCAWLYENTAATGHYFELAGKSLLVNEMIDLGTGTHPAFADVNGDGLKDLVVGTLGYFTFGNPNNARLYLFLNTGTQNAPAFTLADPDWLGLSEFVPDDYDFAPTFGDIDGDQDLDLLVGSNGGGLYCYVNLAGAGAPMQFQRDQNPMWLSMDVGLASAPVIIDLDGDGLPDVVMGERNGNINYFRNTGSPTEPQFANSPTVQVLGGVNMTLPGEIVGFSAPVFLPQAGGDYLLVAGAQGGHLEAYDNVTASGGPFNLVSDLWGGIDEGNRSHPALADLDNDGLLELVMGNFRGGLSMYKTVLVDCGTTSVSGQEADQPGLAISVYPNPVQGQAFVTVPDAQGGVQWRAYNLLGQATAEGEQPDNAFSLSTAGWEPGIYLLEVTTGNRLRGVVKLSVR